MKLFGTFTASVLYVVALYGLMRACLYFLGPFELTPDAEIEWRGVGYVAIAAFSAAVICVGLFLLIFGRPTIYHAMLLAGLALIVQSLYEISQKGLSGFLMAWSLAPAHSVTTTLVIAVAPLIVATVAAISWQERVS